MTGDHTLAPGGDQRSRLFTIQQTSSVLPTTLAVTNNDRLRSEMNFNRRSVGVWL
ncbi:hypothetical protein [Geomicrobium sp. JCM 19039]|uniref:hypothetical protein n=1 Tax=Geomicrobium sp. JCM 19039 TaxID=1460636 RepID=UPI00045F3FC2|nr:hypothetical protein [Geomicrobium sp. JCM 19039]GAK12147.1 hypothetical protein JCM19039_1888 [Geomicrobium sp. JCM 19039]